MGHRITVLALGSRGDVQLFVSLGQALQRAGHRVRVATFRAFAPLIQGAGLEFFPLPGDAEVLRRRAAQGDALFGRNPVAGIQALARSYGTLGQSLPAVIADLGDADLVLNQLPSFLFAGDDPGGRGGPPQRAARYAPRRLGPARREPSL